MTLLDESIVKRRRASERKYKTSEKGRATRRKYWAEKGRPARRVFNSPEERELARKTYMQEYGPKYFTSIRGKEVRGMYLASPAGKAATQRYEAKRRALRDPKEHREYNRAWVKANPEKARIHRRCKALKKYGLNADDPMGHWKTEWVSQGEACKVCRTKEPGSKWGWHTDHCHTTGKFRGILCHKCNLTLGSAGDDLDRLRRCVEYLEKGGRILCLEH